jgi:hypothetical protein
LVALDVFAALAARTLARFVFGASAAFVGALLVRALALSIFVGRTLPRLALARQILAVSWIALLILFLVLAGLLVRPLTLALVIHRVSPSVRIDGVSMPPEP